MTGAASKQSLTLNELNAAFDAYAEKMDLRIDSLFEKRLSASLEKFSIEIRTDLLKEINYLKSVIEKQGLEISELKRQVLFQSELRTELNAFAQFTHEQMRREIASNVVISGLPEDSKDDADHVKDILTSLDCSNCEVIRLERIGRATVDRSRLLKVKFRLPSEKVRVVRNSRHPRNDIKFNGVYVKPDLTFAERHERKRLRVKMDDLRRQNKNGNITITKGVLYQDGFEVDHASPHRYLFRPQDSPRAYITG